MVNTNNQIVYNYYCDESCHLLNDRKEFMVLGYVSVKYSYIRKIKYKIKELRKKHKNIYEVKWTKLNAWNYKFYADLIDMFFEHSFMSFRAIIINKTRYLGEKCDNDYDKFYYLMYYQLIIHKLDSGSLYNIFLDIKDDLSQYRIEELKKILNVNLGVMQKIQHVRSHEVELIQLCDLIIGAISYKLNNKSMSSEPKKKLIAKIESHIRRDVTEKTAPKEEKFNVFRINI